MSRRVLPSGDRAILVECDDLDDVIGLHAALDATRKNGVLDLVPAERTVLIRVDPERLPLESATTWAMQTAGDSKAVASSSGPIVIDVDYDGDDLNSLAEALRISRGDLVARHSAVTWRVAFSGFAPGFGYLVSDEWTLDVPRLASPRPRVAAGSVGLAGSYSGIYPRESPGGWQLIGRTSAPLWDANAHPPALLVPGRTVRFQRRDAGHG